MISEEERSIFPGSCSDCYRLWRRGEVGVGESGPAAYERGGDLPRECFMTGPFRRPPHPPFCPRPVRRRRWRARARRRAKFLLRSTCAPAVPEFAGASRRLFCGPPRTRAPPPPEPPEPRAPGRVNLKAGARCAGGEKGEGSKSSSRPKGDVTTESASKERPSSSSDDFRLTAETRAIAAGHTHTRARAHAHS